MKKKISCLLCSIVLLLGVGCLYIALQSNTIYGGDAGELASAINVVGIAHPPGYPLYTLLGINLINFIPLGTLAWKISFLSSIPAVLSLIVLFNLLVYQTKRIYISFISVLVLGFTYPFWLYSVTVEVFALNNLFTVLLLYLLLRWSSEGKKKLLYFSFFIFGLSLTHHHIILFLLPALIYLLFQRKDKLKSKSLRRNIPKFIILLFIGLLPYLYVIFSARSNPPVNWLGSAGLSNVIKLITRADYGTFRAGPYISHHPVLRLANVFSFLDFLYKDFRLFGILLILIGSYYLIKNKKTVFISLFIGIISYLFFLFYASFPLSGNFLVGTFERFVQPLYLIITILIAYGFMALYLQIEKVARSRSKTFSRVLFSGVSILLLLYPLSLFIINYPKIGIIKNDFTAEKLGRDILNSVPSDSIIIISNDTPLFDTQYVYYAEKKWPNIKLIHLAKLYTPYYFDQLSKYYPDIILPDKENTDKDRLVSFIEANYSKFPVYSKLSFNIPGTTFIPLGLLFRFYKNEDVMGSEKVILENSRLWALYNDPLLGSLSKYQNLMLSDVLSTYAIAHQEFGYYATVNKYLDIAQLHLLEAEKLFPDDLDSYVILAQVYIMQKECQKAQSQIDEVLSRDAALASGYYLRSINYSVCFKDQEKALYYRQLYEQKIRQKETQLQKL